ncbi:MAG: RNA polymerase sigma factor [Winogradskyella sp.]|uniref:RNA polymerase sigma factor n=1 Tax=Winogradskyella sp. TaxID=1883156 RepID=UPI000F41D0DF|nr:RNA polymerase sigma factor [Winogradskyella sp.]RNC86257.1 MAG: RNA polymerase sigma factor [Winogradskyella sp.]
MTELKDEVLLDNLKRGDVNALGKLYERYKTVLFNYFLRTVRDYDASNDLLMETFERVYKYRNSYQSSRKVRSWLFQIASNLTKDYFKKTKQSTAIGNSWREHTETKTTESEISSDITYRNSALMRALNQLKPTERNLINMYYLLEMSYEDMATAEGITVNNARIKVCRALKRLKETLKDSEL